jgi:TatD DNase family protein
MFVDTHCHLSILAQKKFDTLFTPQTISAVTPIIDAAAAHDVRYIIDIGTSLIESKNCMQTARTYPGVYAVVGIHPNDLKHGWRDDLKEIAMLARTKQDNKIVGIGECGFDFHYPDYNINQQRDAFKIQIDCALENDLALVVHTRNARDETLKTLEEYKGQIKKGIIHCFSEDQEFANIVIGWGFALGIGGIITYPKNNALRDIVSTISLRAFVLETDAPFLPIQSMRGKQNHPQYIPDIAQYIAALRNQPLETIAQATTANALRIFDMKNQ